MIKQISSALGFALVLALAAPLAASAQTAAPAMAAMPAMPAMDVSSVDCSTAPAHMTSMMTPPAGAMEGMKGDDTDKTYAALMKMMVMHADMMSKIEMKCGKNAKAMAMAKKMEAQLNDNYLTVEALQNGF